MASTEVASPRFKEVKAQGSILSQIGSDCARNTGGVFDRTRHMPPRLNGRGLNVDTQGMSGNQLKASQAGNILASADESQIKIPDWWKKSDKTNPN